MRYVCIPSTYFPVSIDYIFVSISVYVSVVVNCLNFKMFRTQLYIHEAGIIREICENFMPQKFPPIWYHIFCLSSNYSLSIIFTPRVHKFHPCQYFIPVFHSTDYWQPKWLRSFETITCTIPELCLMLPRKMQNNIGSALKFLFGH